MKIEKRIAVYKIALDETKKDMIDRPDYVSGLCRSLTHAARISELFKNTLDCGSAYGYMGKNYPEIQAHKPKSKDMCGLYWFPKNAEGREIRIGILEKAIETCNLLLTKSV